ncbi:MAG: molybdopterin-dependent oxidoreductase [Planctomycetes bacterium]|nr:molybdopterin-dependent oxidoreductase [Planctomycetota bacterium]
MPLRKAAPNARAVLTIEGACARPTGFSLHDLQTVHDYYQVPDVSKIDERLTGKAVRLRKLIDMVGPDFHCKYLTVHSEDGAYSICLPLEDTSRSALVIYEVKKGTPLGREQGGPVRFVIPYHPDKCTSVKGAVRMVVSEEPGPDSRPSDPVEHEKLHAAQASKKA